MTDPSYPAPTAQEEMIPLGEENFSFRCHPGVSCYTVCCRKVDLQLYPYDVVRLKTALGMHSEDFMRRYTRLVRGDNPFFPTVMLQLTEDGRGDCPFLVAEGCSIYAHRPTACRTYPLARGVRKSMGSRRLVEEFFLVKHDYCKGHDEPDQVTARRYVRSQKLEEYLVYNDLWAELDALFRSNPWQGEGAGGPRQQLAFMACYNIDGFRRFATEEGLLDQYQLSRERRRAIAVRDDDLLKFALEWLVTLLGGASSLQSR